jgi:hypothetical protein
MLSETEMVALLTRLAARHLTPSEILGASLRRNAKGHLPLLKARIERKAERFLIWVGTNPYYTAMVRHDPSVAEFINRA